jgi:hypothetical protein
MSALFPSKAFRRASKLRLYRWPNGFLTHELQRLDPGVNYFVAMLEQLGCATHWSCEGHPKGFYVVFVASYELALSIKNCGFFEVEIEGQSRWSIRRKTIDALRQQSLPKDHALGLAAAAWERSLGPLRISKIVRWPSGCTLQQRKEADDRYERERGAGLSNVLQKEVPCARKRK